MKVFFCLMLLLNASFLSLEAQKVNDKLLTVFFNIEKSNKTVFTELAKSCDTIHIIDTSNYFSKDLKIDFIKAVIIDTEYIRKPLSKEWYCNKFIISIKNKSKNIYILTYLQESSNRIGIIKYRLVNGKFRKIKSQYGQL